MNGCNCCVLRNLASISSMKKQAQGGANLVLIAVPDICPEIFSLNSKQLFLRRNSGIEMFSSVGSLQMPVSLSLSPKE